MQRIPISGKMIDATGEVYELLTLLYPVRVERRIYWLCRCECGNEKAVERSNLKSGDIRSCGCLKTELWLQARTKHGLSGTPEYESWKSLRQRCNNPNDHKYPTYGGRGIRVCKRWDSFSNFISDMGKKPSKRHSIDRKDNDGDYEPSNCRWATPSQQARNTAVSRMIEHNGITLNISDWSDRLGIKAHTISRRLARGWSVEEALTRNTKRGKGTYVYHR